jgi:ribosomal protein S18 acetylase RimI-like enzyme
MNQAKICVKVASTADEIESLRPFWTKLNRHPETDIDFVCKLAVTRPSILRLHILVAYQGIEPIAMMIGRLETESLKPKLGYLKLFKIPLRQFVFLREGFVGEYSSQVATLMVAEIQKTLAAKSADLALVCNIPVDSGLLSVVRQRGRFFQRDYTRRQIEHWKSELPDSFEAFLAKRPRKHRSELRRIGKVFEREFPDQVRYIVFTLPGEVDSFCIAAEKVASNTYQRGMNAGFIDDNENRERVDLATRKGSFRGYVVFVGNRPLAFWAGELLGQVMFLTWTGFDPEFRKFEVGTILFLKMVEDLTKLGVREIDYGLGWAKYKERFGDVCLREQNVAIYAPTLKGYSLNLICTMEELINGAGKKLLSWFKLGERIKRIWRSRLEDKTVPVDERAIKTQNCEVESNSSSNAGTQK